MTKHVAKVLDILEGYGYETSAFQTKPEPDSAKKEAQRAGLAGFDLVIAAGGDGTINEVVNGIAPLAKRPKMAIIPTGTTNDYARALKIPRTDPIAAARVIGKQQTIKMDIGLARESDYFINIAAAGTLTELTYSVPNQLKTIFGYLAYVAKGAELLPQVQLTPVKVTHDQGVFDGEVSLIFAALTNSIGGFECIAPDAMLDDGYFTLILVKTSNLFDLLYLTRLVLQGGRHIDHHQIEYLKTSYIKIEPRVSGDKASMLINLDGEYGGAAPVELRNLKRHIEFFCNTDAISDEAYSLDSFNLEREEKIQKFAHETENLPF